MQPGFGFRDAAAIAGYLSQLGIDEVYSSPFLRARAGSRHGYDIVDHSSLNPELGTAGDFDQFVAALRDANLGHLADIVPNHMSIDPSANRWWRDVLEHGSSSPFARMFDIDWAPLKPELRGKVLLPILACQYGQALEDGELRLDAIGDAIVLRYHDQILPVNRASAAVRGIGTAPDVLAAINGRAGDPESFDRLHDLLEAQAYRLAYWRTSAHEINYRRFFDVDALAGVRVEAADVFQATHELIGALIGRGAITGVRVDHPDGLAVPAEYFERLQRLAADRLGRADAEAALHVVAEKILTPGQTLPASWRVHGTTGYQFMNLVNGLFVATAESRALRRLYQQFTGERASFAEIAYRSRKLVMETSLASELNVLAHALNRISERNRRSRDFTLNSLRRALREFIACLAVYRTYISATGRDPSDDDRIFSAIGQARRRNPELESSIFDFIGDVLLDADQAPVEPGRARPARYPPVDADDRADRLGFTLKLQQYTGPVHAKGLEDTAFYRYNVLISLNEVGGDPAAAGVTVEEFHRQNRARLADWPLELVATSTHDAKLGEDVRARVNVLSEIPDRWRAELGRWSRLNAAHRTRVDEHWWPDRNDEYRLYQVLLGIWPPAPGADPRRTAAALRPRVAEYMLKAAREAKLHTSWINENDAYDRALTAFVAGVLEGRTAARFLDAFVPFAREVARAGMINSLAQTLLKIGVPGVPDFYQGSEMWNLQLVDPDNRAPVDYQVRRDGLESLAPLLAALERQEPVDRSAEVRDLIDHWFDGRIKVFVTAAGLRLRRRYPAVFLDGAYWPLETTTSGTASLVAFGREAAGQIVIVAVPRLSGGVSIRTGGFPIGDVWADDRIHLPPEWRGLEFQQALTGVCLQPVASGAGISLRAADVLATCPVALLRHPAHNGASAPQSVQAGR